MKPEPRIRDSATPPPGSDAGSPGDAALRASDAALVELLRTEDGPGVSDLASALGVTATAVRQRLDRLMRDGIVARDVLRPASRGDQSGRSRGRPAFGYRLTEKGRRSGGDNFRDLALVLWRELRAIEAPEIRRGLVSRIGTAMAGAYRDRVSAAGVAERLEQTVGLLRERRISCSLETPEPGSGPLAVLTSHVCPYPELAERDRTICVAERQMLQDLVGARVTLASCRLDGAEGCRFEVAQSRGAHDTEPLPSRIANHSTEAP